MLAFIWTVAALPAVAQTPSSAPAQQGAASDTDLFAGYCYGAGLFGSTLTKGMSLKKCDPTDTGCIEVRDLATRLVQPTEEAFAAAEKYLKHRRFFDQSADSPAAKALLAEAHKGGADLAACLELGDGRKKHPEACNRWRQCKDILILHLDADPGSVVTSPPNPMPSEKRL
jgi:hypothetical protein